MKKLKKLTAIISTILLTSSLFVGCGSTDPSKVINVFNCGDYINEDLIDKFEEETGYKIVYSTYDTNEIMYSKVKAGSTKYDLVFPSDYMVEKMISEGLAEKINFDNIPNYKYIDDKYKNLSYDPNNEYSVPYMWGTFGIIYDTTVVKDDNIDWNILWDEKYKDNTIMFNSLRDAMGISLARLGYSMNSTDKSEIEKAAAELLNQKNLARAWMVDEVKDAMRNKEAAIATVWSGDAAVLLNEDKDLKYVVPASGSNKWFDAMVIPKGAKNKEGAEAFINFLTDPDNALENVEYIGYYTPNSETFKLLDKKTQSTYPSDEVLDKCEIFTNLPDDVLKLYSEEWTKVTGA